MIKIKYVYYASLGALAFILFGSAIHLTHTFSTLETGWLKYFVSPLLGFGVEVAMLAIALGITERRRKREGAKDLYFYLSFFAFLNFFANVSYSFSTLTKNENLAWNDLASQDLFKIITVVLLSGTLPFLVLALTELQSIFYNRMILDIKKEEAERLASENTESGVVAMSTKKKNTKGKKQSKIESESSKSETVVESKQPVKVRERIQTDEQKEVDNTEDKKDFDPFEHTSNIKR